MSAHDLGGKPGFGPVPVDDDAVFHTEWERRAYGVTQFAQVTAGFNTDAFRHGIEREDPDRYVELSYFDRWIRNAERMLVEGGVLASDAVPAAIDGRAASGQPKRTTDAEAPLARGAARAIDEPPALAVGDRVRVSAARPTGHTRIPGYVRGRVGTVERQNDTWILPDAHAHGRGEQPCWVYAVRFSANDLWPEDHSNHTVLVDMYEPYLTLEP